MKQPGGAWVAFTWDAEDIAELAVYGPFEHREEADRFLAGIDKVLGEEGPSVMVVTHLHAPWITVTAEGVRNSLGREV